MEKTKDLYITSLEPKGLPEEKDFPGCLYYSNFM